MLNPVFTDNKLDWGKKYFPPRYDVEVEPYLFQVRTHYPDRKLNAEETSIEKRLGGKLRIANMEKLRNGMPLTAPGDKNFRNPEYSVDFFKGGGLIPGSSTKPNMKRNASKKADTFYQTLDLSKRTLNPDKLWVNKVRKEKLNFDNDYVKTLVNWEKNVLEDVVPKQVKQTGKAVDAKKGQVGNAGNKKPQNKK